jgi:hypothetical protein
MCIHLSFLGNGSVKSYRGNEYTRNYRIIVGHVFFYVVRVVSRKVGDYLFAELFVIYKEGYVIGGEDSQLSRYELKKELSETLFSSVEKYRVDSESFLIMRYVSHGFIRRT